MLKIKVQIQHSPARLKWGSNNIILNLPTYNWIAREIGAIVLDDLGILTIRRKAF